MNFDAFVDDIKKYSWNVHGVEVYEDGILTHSYGDTKDNIYSIYSATKTILSVAVGIAIDEEKFDIGRSVLDYLPEKNTERISEFEYTERAKQIQKGGKESKSKTSQFFSDVYELVSNPIWSISMTGRALLFGITTHQF